MRSLIKFLVDYVFPPTCISCPEFTIDSNGFCASCWLKLDFISEPYCETCGTAFNISAFEGFYCGKCLQQKPSFDSARSILKFN